MSPQAVLNIFSTLTTALPLQPVSLLAVPAEGGKQRPAYVLLASGGQKLQAETEQRLETLLQGHFHYQLARELGQLDPARVILSDNAITTYTQLRLRSGAVAGNIKVEPLLLCPAASELLNTLPEDSPAESGAIA